VAMSVATSRDWSGDESVAMPVAISVATSGD
jgi:hypothetical protein